jgi:hypothetical protein
MAAVAQRAPKMASSAGGKPQAKKLEQKEQPEMVVRYCDEMLKLLQEDKIREGPMYSRKNNSLTFDVYLEGTDEKDTIGVQFGTFANPISFPFGVNKIELTEEQIKKGEKDKDPNKKNLDMALNRGTHPLEREVLELWDKRNVNVFTSRSSEFFGKEKSKEVVEDAFLKFVQFAKKPKDPVKAKAWNEEKAKKYAPSLRIKVLIDGENKTQVFKMTKRVIDGKTVFAKKAAHADDVKKFSKGVVVASNVGGWFVGIYIYIYVYWYIYIYIGNQFGESFFAKTIYFFEPEARNLPANAKLGEGEMLVDEEDLEDEEMEMEDGPAPPVEDNNNNNNNANVNANNNNANTNAIANAATGMIPKSLINDDEQPPVIQPSTGKEASKEGANDATTKKVLGKHKSTLDIENEADNNRVSMTSESSSNTAAATGANKTQNKRSKKIKLDEDE